jgi:hypothetical protein
VDSQANANFAAQLLGSDLDISPFTPTAFHSVEGDCIEIVLSQDTYFGRRLCKHITVLLSEDTEKPVGLILKGVRSLIAELAEGMPGFLVEIEHNRLVKVEYFITAVMWKKVAGKDQAVFKVLEAIREAADESDLTLEFAD